MPTSFLREPIASHLLPFGFLLRSPRFTHSPYTLPARESTRRRIFFLSATTGTPVHHPCERRRGIIERSLPERYRSAGVSPAGAHPRGRAPTAPRLLSSTRDLRPRARRGRKVLPSYAGARARTRAPTERVRRAAEPRGGAPSTFPTLRHGDVRTETRVAFSSLRKSLLPPPAPRVTTVEIADATRWTTGTYARPCATRRERGRCEADGEARALITT